MIRTFAVTLAIGLAFAATAGAWGLPAALTASTSSSSDPDAFLAKALVAETLIDKSADSLFKAVANKEEQARMEEMQKQLNETTDDKEKNKQLRKEIMVSKLATIGKQANDKKLQRDAKNWGEQKKKSISDAFFNFSLGALQAGLLVPEGTNMATSIASNPLNAARFAFKITSVLDSVKTIKGILGGTANVIGAMKPLMSSANIAIKVPSSATEAQKDASEDI